MPPTLFYTEQTHTGREIDVRGRVIYKAPKIVLEAGCRSALPRRSG